jgi:hypothetical protein
MRFEVCSHKHSAVPKLSQSEGGEQGVTLPELAKLNK